jgi:hypothetical protein
MSLPHQDAGLAEHGVDWRHEALTQADLIASLYRRLAVCGELLSTATTVLHRQHRELQQKSATVAALRADLRRLRGDVSPRKAA